MLRDDILICAVFCLDNMQDEMDKVQPLPPAKLDVLAVLMSLVKETARDNNVRVFEAGLGLLKNIVAMYAPGVVSPAASGQRKSALTIMTPALAATMKRTVDANRQVRQKTHDALVEVSTDAGIDGLAVQTD